MHCIPFAAFQYVHSTGTVCNAYPTIFRQCQVVIALALSKLFMFAAQFATSQILISMPTGQ